MIEPQSKDLSVRDQCRLLQVNRSTVYYQAVACADDSVLMNQIHDLWVETPFYGYRRIWAALCYQGYQINMKRVQRLMKVLNLQAIYPKPRLSKGEVSHQKYPYLLAQLSIDRANMVWCTDITYIKMPRGFVYLVALIDVYSRYIVSWCISISLEMCFCIQMLEEAFGKAIPEFVNTDQGSQFTSPEWVSRVEGAGAKVSMDGKGRWADNIPVERFWRTLKYEDIFLHSYETVAQVKAGIRAYIVFYNEQRPHQSLGYARPVDVYTGEQVAKPYRFKKRDVSGLCDRNNTEDIVANGRLDPPLIQQLF